MFGSRRWLVLVAAGAQLVARSLVFAQTAPPAPPTNLRIVNGPVSTSCPAGQTGTPPNCVPLPPAPAASGKQWTVAFAEEFNGTALDTTKLTPCFDWNYGSCTSSFNTGKEHYQPSQVQVSNGTAKLVAEPLSPALADSACYQGQCTYKAGLVSTARPRADNGSPYLFAFTYGYIESRMKFPGLPGFFTAFWMLPADPSYNYRSEIDIVEILGGFPDTIFMHHHYNNRSTSYTPNNGLHNNGACPVKDYSTDWVRFGLDWQPTYVAWYIDGVKCGQFNGNTTTIENGPMQVILHMMIDNQWEREWGSVLSSQTLVRQLEVDYIRIYQQR
jgi:beta-glucanase (GH16 family)